MSNAVEYFGNAKWIGLNDAAYPNPIFRGDFDVPEKACNFSINICGLGICDLYLNGRHVSNDLFSPVTSDYVKRDIIVNGKTFPEEWHHRCYFRQWDVSEYLHCGKNKLAVSLGSGFFSIPQPMYGRNVTYGQPRLIFRINWKNTDGTCGEFLSSPDTVKACRGVVIKNDFYTTEKQDLRIQRNTWTVDSYDEWEIPALLPDMDTTYLPQKCESDKIIRRITPRKIYNGHGVAMYDAGENITGRVVLKDNVSAGKNIVVRFGEERQGVHLDPGYQHKQQFEVISDGSGRIVYPMYMWYGFRYFNVAGNAEVMCVEVIHSDIPVESCFHSSSQLLNWIWEAYVRTELNNWHCGIPSDCPHIERKGYTGDGQLTAETFLLLLNNKALCRKWIDDICDCQDIHTGHVQYTAPYYKCGGGPGGWGIAIIHVPYEYYVRYGEKNVLQQCHQGMCRYIDFLENHSQGGLVVSDIPGQWCLGDWCTPNCYENNLPEPFVNTCFMITALQELMEVEKILGMDANPRWEKAIKTCSEGIISNYYNESTGSFVDGTRGSDAFAISCGLGSPKTLANLVEYYTNSPSYDTGIFGTEVLTRVLFNNGESHLAYRLISSEDPASFAGWMDMDSTTLWEYFPGGNIQRSLDHPMFGALVKEFVYRILGIQQESGTYGWESVVISPVLFREVAEAEGKIPVESGEISVKYKFDCVENLLTLNIGIPEKIRAKVTVEGNIVPLHCGMQTLQIKL